MREISLGAIAGWLVFVCAVTAQDERTLDRDRLARLVDRVSRSVESTDMTAANAIESVREIHAAEHDLIEETRKNPAAWEAIRGSLIANLEKAKSDEVKSRLINVLVLDKRRETAERLARLLGRTPGLFTVDALMTMDERGFRAARRALVGRVKKGGLKFRMIRPAAHLAFRGDPTGRETLRWAVEDERLRRDVTNEYMAGLAGLVLLGERSYWRIHIGSLVRMLEATGDEKQLRRAQTRVLQAKFFGEKIKEGSRASFAALDRQYLGFVHEYSGKKFRREELRQLLHRLVDLRDKTRTTGSGPGTTPPAR